MIEKNVDSEILSNILDVNEISKSMSNNVKFGGYRNELVKSGYSLVIDETIDCFAMAGGVDSNGILDKKIYINPNKNIESKLYIGNKLHSLNVENIIEILEHEISHCLLYKKLISVNTGLLNIFTEEQSKIKPYLKTLFPHIKLSSYDEDIHIYNEFYTELIRLSIRGELGDFLIEKVIEEEVNCDHISTLNSIGEVLIK